MKQLRSIIVFVASFFLWEGLSWCLVSCKPSMPGDVIPQDDMADIIYDYHVAKALLHQEPVNCDEYEVNEEIFRKHDVTRAEFDSSLVYYVRHYRLLQAVYGEVEDRLSKRAIAMGGNVQDLTSMGADFENGDTTNIWKYENSMLFVPYTPYNVFQFDIKADTTIKAGDRFLLSFDTDFIVQAGRRDLVAMLAIRFQNDSVASTAQHISSPMHSSITVSDDMRLGIKSISGFFTLTTDPDDPQTTTKVAIAKNIKLVHLHTEDPKAKESEEKDDEAKADSTENKQDSIQTTSNNGIQETPLGSASGPAPDRVRRESAVLPEKRLSRAQP